MPTSDIKKGPLYVDSTNNRVGIGTSSPSGLLNAHNASGDANVFITSGTTTSSTTLFFGDSGSTDRGRVQYDHNNDSMRLHTAGSEAARLDASGNLLVGTTDSLPAINNVEGIALSAGSFGGRLEVSRDNSEAVSINRKTSDGSLMSFKKDGTTVGSIASRSNIALTVNSQSGNGNLAYGGTNYVEWNNTRLGVATDNTIDLGRAAGRWKDLYLSGGVYLGGTGSANYLDDYEEGTWTPVIQDSSGNSSSTAATHSYYTKIGRQVTVVFIMSNFDTTGLLAGEDLRIAGFPFQSNGYSVGSAIVNYLSTTNTDQTNSVYSYMSNNSTYVHIYETRRNASGTISNVSAFNSGLADIYLTHTYFTD